MPGINLSQTAQQKTDIRRHPILGKGLIAIIVVLLLAVAAWRGLLFWESRINKEVEGIEAETAKIRVDFDGEQADQVVGFQFRLDSIAQSFVNKTYPADMLRSLESLMLGGIDLSEYSFDAQKQSITITGQSDSFLAVAQQMAILKRTPGFDELAVDSLKREETGKISFTFSINLADTP